MTAEDIQRVANRYFKPEKRAVALFYTKKSEGAEDPLLAGLSDQDKAQVRQFQAAVAQMSIDEAKAILQKVEPQVSAAPAGKTGPSGGYSETAAGKNSKERRQVMQRTVFLRRPFIMLACCIFAGALCLRTRQRGRRSRRILANSNIRPLEYTPPKASAYRQVLSNGVVGFFVEDHDLPLVNISVTIRVGPYLDPAGKEGSGRSRGKPAAGRRDCTL